MLKSAALALAFIASITPASAQMLCMSFESAKQMAKNAGEEPQVTGKLPEGWSFLLFATTKGETWTSVMVHPNGQTCILGVGKDLEVLWPTKPDGKDI